MRKTIAKAVTWRLIGTIELFVISLWTTGHIATAGHTAGIAAIASFLTYMVHELAWNGSFSQEKGVQISTRPAGHDLCGPAGEEETTTGLDDCRRRFDKVFVIPSPGV